MKELEKIEILNGKRGTDISDEEIQRYVDMGREKYSYIHTKMTGIRIKLDGDDVDVEWEFAVRPFDRIRRITGYLVGTLDRFNDAKRSEVQDRVKHGLGDFTKDLDDVCLSDEEVENLK